MNANELADELERLYQQDVIDGVADLAMPEAATMLRKINDDNVRLLKAYGGMAAHVEELTRFIDERSETGQFIIWKTKQ